MDKNTRISKINLLSSRISHLVEKIKIVLTAKNNIRQIVISSIKLPLHWLMITDFTVSNLALLYCKLHPGVIWVLKKQIIAYLRILQGLPFVVKENFKLHRLTFSAFHDSVLV